MHDIKFAREIIHHLKNALAGNEHVKFVSVNISLSPFSHVSPEGLRSTFELLVETEGLKNVILKIRPLAYKVTCKKCGNVFEISKVIFCCNQCQSTNIDIKFDKEFSVDSIEIE